MRALFAEWAKPAALAIEFEETRHLTVLTDPLVLHGEIRFVRGRGVIMDYMSPKKDRRVFHSGRAPQTRGAPHRGATSSGGQNNPTAGFLADMLAGDQARLEKEFHLEFKGELAEWSLLFTPKSEMVRKRLSRIELEGGGPEIRKIEIFFAGENRHVITVSAVQVNPEFEENEVRGL